MSREERRAEKQQRTQEIVSQSPIQIGPSYSPFTQKQQEQEYAAEKESVTTEQAAQSLSNLGVPMPSFMTQTSPYISENPGNKSFNQSMQEAWLNMANPMEQALSYTFYNNFKYQLGLTPNDVKVSDMIDFTTYINETSSGTIYSFEEALQGYVAMQSQFGGTLEYYSPTKEVKLYHDYIQMQTMYGGVSEEVAAQQYVDARNKALQWSNTLEKSVLGQVAMGSSYTSILTSVSPNYIDAVGASIASIANEGYDYDGEGIVDTNGNYLTGSSEVSGKEFLQTLTLAEQGNAMAQKEVTEMKRQTRNFGFDLINLNGKLWDTSMMFLNGMTATVGSKVGRAELAIENIGEDAATRQANVEEFNKNTREDMTMLVSSLGYSYEGISEFIFQADTQESAKAWVDDHFLVSLALEICLDPTTYMTLGFTTIFKSTTKSLKALDEVKQSTSALNKSTANFRKFNAPGSEVKGMDLETDLTNVEKLKASNIKKKETYTKRRDKEMDKLKKAQDKYAKLFDLDPKTMKSLYGSDIVPPPKKWYNKQGIRKRRAFNKINQSKMAIKNYNIAIKNLENLDFASDTFLKFSTKIVDQIKETPGYKAEVEIKQLIDEFDALEKQVKTLNEQLEAKKVAQRNLGTIVLELENKIKTVGGLETLEDVLEQLSYTNIEALDISADEKNELKSLYNKLRKTNDKIDAIRPEMAKIVEAKTALAPEINEKGIRLRQLIEMVNQRENYGNIKTYDTETFARINEAIIKNATVNVGNQFFSSADFEQEFRKYVNKRYKGKENKETREKLFKESLEYKKNFVIDNWLIDADIRYGLDGEVYSAAKQEIKHGYYDPANTDKLKSTVTKILKDKGYKQDKIDKAMGFIDMEMTQLTPEEFVHSMNSYHQKLSKNFDKGLQPTASFVDRTMIDEIDEFSDLIEKDVLLKNGFVNYQDVLQFNPEYTRRLPHVAVRRFTDASEMFKNALHNTTSRAGRQISKMKNNNAIFASVYSKLIDMGVLPEEIALNTTIMLDLLNETMHNWSLAELEKRVFDPSDNNTSIIALNEDFRKWAEDFTRRINKNETLVEFYGRDGKKQPSDFARIRVHEKESVTGRYLTLDLSEFKNERANVANTNPEIYHALETEMNDSLEYFFKNYAYGEYVPFTKKDLNSLVDGLGVDGNFEISLADVVGTAFFKDIMEAIIETNGKIANRHATEVRRAYNQAQRDLVTTTNRNYQIKDVFDEEEFEYYKMEAINKFFDKTFINYQRMSNEAKGEVLKTIRRKSRRTVQDVLLGVGRGAPRLFNDPDLIKQVGVDNLQDSIYNEIDRIALEMARDASELGLKGIDFQQELITAINQSDLIKKFYDEGSYNLQEDLSKVSMRSILRKMDKNVTTTITDDTIWWSDQFGMGIRGTDRQQNNLINTMRKEYGISKEAAQELLHNRFGFYRIYNQKSTGREVHASSQQPDLRHAEFVGVPHIKNVRSFVKQKEDINVDNQEDLNATFDVKDNEIFNAHILSNEDFQNMELLEQLKDKQFDLIKKIDNSLSTIDKFEEERELKFRADVEKARIEDIQARNNVNTLKNKLSTKVVNEIGEKDITTIIDEFLKADAKQYIKENKEILREELQDNEVFKELYNPDSKNMPVHLNSVLNKTLRFEMTEFLSKVGTKKRALPATKRKYEEIEVEIPNVFDEIEEKVQAQVGEEFEMIKVYEELKPETKLEMLREYLGVDELSAEVEFEKQVVKTPNKQTMAEEILLELFPGGSLNTKYTDNEDVRNFLTQVFKNGELIDKSPSLNPLQGELIKQLDAQQIEQLARTYDSKELKKFAIKLDVNNDYLKKKYGKTLSSLNKEEFVTEMINTLPFNDLRTQIDFFNDASGNVNVIEKLNELGVKNVEESLKGSRLKEKRITKNNVVTFLNENQDKLNSDVWNRILDSTDAKPEYGYEKIMTTETGKKAEHALLEQFNQLLVEGKIKPREGQKLETKEVLSGEYTTRTEKLSPEEIDKVIDNLNITKQKQNELKKIFNMSDSHYKELAKINKGIYGDELTREEAAEKFEELNDLEQDLKEAKTKSEQTSINELIKEINDELDFEKPSPQQIAKSKTRKNTILRTYFEGETLQEQFSFFKALDKEGLQDEEKLQDIIDESLINADILPNVQGKQTIAKLKEEVGEERPQGPGIPIFGEVTKKVQVPRMETKFKDVETGEIFDEPIQPEKEFETIVDTKKLKEIPMKEAREVSMKGDTKAIRTHREKLIQNREMLQQVNDEIEFYQELIKETVDADLVETLERIDFLNLKQGQQQDYIRGLEIIEAEGKVESETIETLDTEIGPQQIKVKAPKSMHIFDHNVNNEELNIVKGGMQEILNIVEGLKPLEDLVTSASFKKPTTSEKTKLERQEKVNEYAAGIQQIQRIFKQDIEPYVGKQAVTPYLDTDFYKEQIGHIEDEIQRREKEFEESYTGISEELDAAFIERAMRNEDFDYTSEINGSYQILQLIEKEKITDQDLLKALYPERLDPTRFSDDLVINEEFARRMSDVVAQAKTVRNVGVTNFKQIKEEYKEPENKTERLKAIKEKQGNGEKLTESELEFLQEVETFERIQQMISDGTIKDVYVLDFSAFKDDPVALEAAKTNLKRIVNAAFTKEYENASKFDSKIPIMKGEIYKENLTKMNEINNNLRDKIGKEMYKTFLDSFNTAAHDLSTAGYDIMVETMGHDLAQKSSVGAMEGTHGATIRNKETVNRGNLFALMNGAVERTNSNPNIRIGHVKTYQYKDHIRRETGKSQTVSGPEKRPVDMMTPLSSEERTRIANEINKKVNATKIIQVPKRKKAQATLKDVAPETKSKVVLMDEGNYITKLVDELASAGVQDLTREDRRTIIMEATRRGGKEYKESKINDIDRRLGKIYDNRRSSEEMMFYNQMSFTERNAKGPLHILNQEATEHIKKRGIFGRETNKSIKMFEDDPIEYLNQYGFMQTQDSISESLILKMPDYIKGFDEGGDFNYITEYKPRNRRPWSKERRGDNAMVKIRVKDILDNDRGLLGTLTRDQKLALREELEALKDVKYRHSGNLDNLSILIDRKDFNTLQNQFNVFGKANNTHVMLRAFSEATRLLKGSALWGGFKTKFALSVPFMTGFLEGQSLSKTIKELKKFTHNDEKLHEWLKKDFSNTQILRDIEKMELDKAFEYIATHGEFSDAEKQMLDSYVFESGARSFSRNLKSKYINVNGKRAKSMRLGDNKPKSGVIDHVTQMGSNVPVMKHLVANFDPMEAGAIVRAKTLFEDTALLERKVREFGLGDANLNDADQRMAASIRIAEDELGIGESDTLAKDGWRGGINTMILFPGFVMRAFPKMMMNYFGTPGQLARMGGLLILFDNFKYAAGYNQYQINSMSAKERTALNFRLPGTSEDGSLQINLFSPLDVLNTFGDIKQATSVTQWLINITNPILLAPIEMATGQEVDSYGQALQNSGYSPLDAMTEAEGIEKVAPAMQYLFTMMTGNIGKIFTQTRNLLSGQDDFGNYYVKPGASDYAINVVNAFAKKFGLNPYERVTIDDIPVLSSIFNYQEDPQGIDAARDIWYDVIKKDFEEYKATVEGTKEGQAVAEKVSKFEKRSQASYVLNQMNKAKQDTNKDMPETLVEGATQKNIEESGLSNYDVLKAKAETAQKQLERKLAYIKAHD